MWSRWKATLPLENLHKTIMVCFFWLKLKTKNELLNGTLSFWTLILNDASSNRSPPRDFTEWSVLSQLHVLLLHSLRKSLKESVPHISQNTFKEMRAVSKATEPSTSWSKFSPLNSQWDKNELSSNVFFTRLFHTEKWLAVLYIWCNLMVLKMLTKLADKKLGYCIPILEDTDNLNKNLDNGFTWGVVLHKYLVLTQGKVTADGEGAGNIFLGQ